MTENTAENAREAVAVFPSEETLQAAIDDLQSHGFDRAEIGLLASERAVEEQLGHRYEKVEELEDDSEVPRVGYVSKESLGDAEGSLIGAPLYVAAVAGAVGVVVSGGSLLAVIAGATAAGGAGALIGTALAKLLGEQHAHHLQEQLEHGGLLLWVRTWDADEEKQAVDILRRHSGSDVHVHGGSAG